MKLSAVISPSGARFKNIVWTSVHPQVATVDTSGQVKAIAIGITKIFASINTDDGIKTDSCEVSVFVPVSGVAFEEKQIDLTIGMQEKLNAFVLPPNAANRLITMTSLNPGVVSVNSAGYITAHGIGTASIIVTTEEGQKKDTCEVTVHPMLSPGTSVETVSGPEFAIFPNPFNGGSLTIKLKRPSNEVKIKVLDVLGRVVYQNDNLSGTEINIQPDFGHGIYIILVESANDYYQTKVIVP